MKLTDQQLKDIATMAETSDSLFDTAVGTVYDALLGAGFPEKSMPIVRVEIHLSYEGNDNDDSQ